jgi:hypothetical protein
MILLLSIFGLCTAVPARASIIPIRLKAGLFFPQKAPLNGGDQWWKIGADADIPIGIALFGHTRIGIEWCQQCEKNTIIPVTVTQIFNPGVAVKTPVYVGAGVGMWTAKIIGTPTATRFGFRILGGVNLTNRYFVEGTYDFVQKVSGISMDGLSVTVGMKF